MNIFCANMMDLNWRAEAIGYAYPTRDIFMENILFCGIGGFSDFYKLRWLEAILSWQKPQEGCFGRPDAEDEELSKAIQHQQHHLRRVKRREKLFADGCSSHNTAMAVGALGGFLYILAQYPPANRELQQATPAPPTDMNGSTPASREDKTIPFIPPSWNPGSHPEKEAPESKVPQLRPLEEQGLGRKAGTVPGTAADE
nr:hypothetical protein HJG63_001714 [Rousettus aegyptiacus]